MVTIKLLHAQFINSTFQIWISFKLQERMSSTTFFLKWGTVTYSYPPRSLYQICWGLQRHIWEPHPNFNFMKDPQLAGFQRTLDSERTDCVLLDWVQSGNMQLLFRSLNKMYCVKKDYLDIRPHRYLSTQVFLCGLYFALRSDQEHRSLTDGALWAWWSSSMPVVHWEYHWQLCSMQGSAKASPNASNPERCFVQLFNKFCQHCPSMKKKTVHFISLH